MMGGGMYPRGRGRGRGGYRAGERESGAGGEEQSNQVEDALASAGAAKEVAGDDGNHVAAHADGEAAAPALDNNLAAASETEVGEGAPVHSPQEQEEAAPAAAVVAAPPPAGSQDEAGGDDKTNSEQPKNLYSGQGALKGRLALSAKRASPSRVPEHLDLRERLTQQLVGC